MLLENKTVRVMRTFLGDLESYRHGSRIAKKLDMNQKTVSNILNRLEEENLLKSRRDGKNKQFSVDFADPEKTLRYILLCETAATIMFLDKNPKIKDIIGKIRPFMKGVVVVFGSYAKGIQRKNSDLDILVAGTCNKNRIREISEMYDIDISVKTLNEKSFITALKRRDILMKEIISNHILISGSDSYVQNVVRYYYGR
ncbi:MAG: nucleotidyltransferase domain-containing protein [Candidatus Woesearchaeota archaeon]